MKKGVLSFETGRLPEAVVDRIFNSLPVDITFIDKDDAVGYYAPATGRIFPRSPAVIGRKVQQCHPQKSLSVVNKILEDFKSGARNSAEFWINLQGKVIHIRYFAVRDKGSKYLGTLEVSQDITAIQKLEGEKRLLD